MVAGFHLVWTAYGWWLPNDPRGSTSHEIRVEHVAQLGDLHHGRKQVQPRSREIGAFYDEARDILKNELLTFNDDDISLIGESFGAEIVAQRYTCYACAVMPDHVHMLIRKHKHRAEAMIENLQNASKAALITAGRRTGDHPVWGGPGWKVFVNTQNDFRPLVRYIEDNPRKARRPDQHWDFVKPYDGWLPGSWNAKR